MDECLPSIHVTIASRPRIKLCLICLSRMSLYLIFLHVLISLNLHSTQCLEITAYLSEPWPFVVRSNLHSISACYDRRGNQKHTGRCEKGLDDAFDICRSVGLQVSDSKSSNTSRQQISGRKRSLVYKKGKKSL